MGVRFDQLLAMPELKDLKLVAGSNGTYKIVRWVHVVETPDLLKYVQNDELIILTGMGVLNNPPDFVELIEGLIEKNAAGLILNVGKYFESVPDEIKRIGDENEFAIMELPWEISIAEETKIICEEIVKRHMEEMANQDLLMNIIFFNKVSYEDFVKRLSDYSYGSFKSYRIAIVSMEGLQHCEDDQRLAGIKQVFYNSVNSAASDSRHRAISYLVNKSVILLLLNEKERYTNLNIFADMIRENCKNNFPELSFTVSMGNVYSEFSQIKRSYLEAEKAIKAARAEGGADRNVSYSDIGAYKLLTEIENTELLKQYYIDTLGRLEQYDVQNNSDFMEILYTFLQEDGSYIQTASRLFMHRNTLLYKINKIHEILKADLSDPRVRFEINLGFMVKKLLNE
ncbi:MAG: transcriptional regulator, PucR family [Firmicutes bacterium]|nr:transcriptional regulator, PucR family [Bacillota bacterium]